MRRMICVVLAVMMLPFFVACGEKKDQVVHVGETVKYGDLAFTFIEYDADWHAICVKCVNNGHNEFVFRVTSFDVYADNESVGQDMVGSGSVSEKHGDGKNYYQTIASGREAKLWILPNNVPQSTKILEFDYSIALYSKKWGKVTFAVDMP